MLVHPSLDLFMLPSLMQVLRWFQVWFYLASLVFPLFSHNLFISVGGTRKNGGQIPNNNESVKVGDLWEMEVDL